VSKAELIPIERAEFFFNRQFKKPPHDFLVVDQQSRFQDGNLVEDYDSYHGSLGAHCASWMSDDYDWPHSTPEGVFASLCLDGNSDRESIKNILREFSKIKGCEWAKLMYQALDFKDCDQSSYA
jgi:hypothetical protein